MKIIVDTNIVFSAILNSNSRIGKILLNSKEHFQFFSCDYLRVEIHRHRNKLLKLTKLTEVQLSELESLVTQKITCLATPPVGRMFMLFHVQFRGYPLMKAMFETLILGSESTNRRRSSKSA